MTPTDIITAARDLYNGVSDSFYSDTLMLNWIWQACHDFAKRAWLIENVYSSTTVSAQQTYSFPANAIAIRRITVNGRKLKRITGREDDAITLSNQAVTTQGWPIYYTEFNYNIYLRPIPDSSSYTLQIYTYDDAPQITAASTIPVPLLFHFDIVDFLLMRMYTKDKDTANATNFAALWEKHIKEAISYRLRRKRTDSFATVQNEDTLPVTILGEA